MKKVLVLILALIIVCTFGIFIGCKSTTTTTAAAETTAAATETSAAAATAAETTKAAEPITIEFWSWNNEGAYPKVHEDAEKRFMAKYPNVTIYPKFP